MRNAVLALSVAALAACSSGSGAARGTPSPTPSPTPVPKPFTVAAGAKPCDLLPLTKVAALLGPTVLEDSQLGNLSKEKGFCEVVGLPGQVRLVYLSLFEPDPGTVFTKVKDSTPFAIAGLARDKTFIKKQVDGTYVLTYVDPHFQVIVTNYLSPATATGVAPESAALLKAIVAARR